MELLLLLLFINICTISVFFQTPHRAVTCFFFSATVLPFLPTQNEQSLLRPVAVTSQAVLPNCADGTTVLRPY
jgi:hypothetical protein